MHAPSLDLFPVLTGVPEWPTVTAGARRARRPQASDLVVSDPNGSSNVIHNIWFGITAVSRPVMEQPLQPQCVGRRLEPLERSIGLRNTSALWPGSRMMVADPNGDGDGFGVTTSA
ncbi:hypothetical protein [Microbispora bryophytorum]|uniref:hypothetical protein n=1 Tax=Microbispora bryophytorum TaxID=1460882 RepID=UPI0034059192